MHSRSSNHTHSQADSTAPTADLLRFPERGPHCLLGCSWDLLHHHRLLLLLLRLLRLLFVLLLVWLLLPAQHTGHRFIGMCAVLRDLGHHPDRNSGIGVDLLLWWPVEQRCPNRDGARTG